MTSTCPPNTPPTRCDPDSVTRDIVLFDLDGTLTDPGVGIFNSVRHAISVLGLDPMTEAQLRGFVGPPLQDTFAALGLPSAAVQTAVEAYRAHYSKAGLYENVVYPGIVQVLDELLSDGKQLAVATSKPLVFARLILERFAIDGYFAAVAGADLDGTRCHKGEVIAEALLQLGVEPARAVMIGDRAHDVLGAAQVGIRCVGVSWGYGEPGELADAGASSIVESPRDLVAAIRCSAVASPGCLREDG